MTEVDVAAWCESAQAEIVWSETLGCCHDVEITGCQTVSLFLPGQPHSVANIECLDVYAHQQVGCEIQVVESFLNAALA